MSLYSQRPCLFIRGISNSENSILFSFFEDFCWRTQKDSEKLKICKQKYLRVNLKMIKKNGKKK